MRHLKEYSWIAALLIARSTKGKEIVDHDTTLPSSRQVFATPDLGLNWGGANKVMASAAEPIIGAETREQIALANRRSRRAKAGKDGGVGKRIRQAHCMSSIPRVLTSIFVLSASTT
jgi:hypothetical protein